jgi:hypothetical protein
VIYETDKSLLQIVQKLSRSAVTFHIKKAWTFKDNPRFLLYWSK